MSNVIKRPELSLREDPVLIKHLPIINQVKTEELEEHTEPAIEADLETVLHEAEAMVREILDKARLEARNIIAEAREDAELIKSESLQEAEQLRIQSKREGYEQGLREAQKESEADRQMALEQSREIIEEARRAKVKMMKSSTADIARLAMAVAKKIVASELMINPSIITNVINEAINFLDQPTNIHVYVNPQAMDNILSGIVEDDFSEMGQKDLNEVLVADARIGAGGCVVESDFGTVDARLETRIAKVEQAIQEVTADDSNETL